MDRMDTFEPKDGDHKGESVVVVEQLNSGVHKCLTLEGDFHYYDQDGYEVKPSPPTQSK